jgi:hypothetical protein
MPLKKKTPTAHFAHLVLPTIFASKKTKELKSPHAQWTIIIRTFLYCKAEMSKIKILSWIILNG